MVINFLSTRIQLGRTSAKMASDLVANSFFASLSGYNAISKAVLIGCYPDPVCARRAMYMMDADYRKEVTILSNPEIVCEKSKKWWTSTLIQIFSSGTVSPDKHIYEAGIAIYPCKTCPANRHCCPIVHQIARRGETSMGLCMRRCWFPANVAPILHRTMLKHYVR